MRYVDLTARAANVERLERRLIDLLARRTGKLEDVLAVERELARVARRSRDTRAVCAISAPMSRPAVRPCASTNAHRSSPARAARG